MEAIPPVFRDPEQRRLYDFYPKPPLTLPLTPGETDEFPRSSAPPLREVIKHRYWQRGSLYRKMARQIATNARRPNRGKHIFIIRPTTMNRLLDAVASIPSPKSEEVRRVLWSMYFQGKTQEEVESLVNQRHHFPPGQQRRIGPTNVIVRLSLEIDRHPRIIRALPNQDEALMPIGSFV